MGFEVFNYEVEGQMSLFDFTMEEFKIDKSIRLIELFAGVGSQAMAIRDLGVEFESYKISEWEVSADASYNAIHNKSDFRNYGKGKTKEYLVRKLYKRGISTDGKQPMSYTEINRKSYEWCLKTYNSFCQNQNLGSITKFKGSALRIVDTDNYCYIMTYSFPCQDLSVAGKQKGMTKGSGTRSGLLWEVERLLNEVDNLPQVLLMENVPQVHGKNNMDDFQRWIEFLESKGYSNYWQDLNAKNYGVAQNRNRCFMVSILGSYRYEFPKPIELTKRMKDYLEDEVDEKFYISNDKASKLIQTLIDNGTLEDRKFYPLIGYEDLYEISKNGNIRSVDRIVDLPNGKRQLKGIILKKLELKNGYYGVNLSKDGKPRMEYVHRLVARNFINNEDLTRDCINHKDGNKHNNVASNLEWCTRTENMKHAWRENLCHSSELTGGVRGVARVDEFGNPIEFYISIAEATRSMGFKTTSSISNCVTGKKKSTHNTYWKYIDELISNGTIPSRAEQSRLALTLQSMSREKSVSQIVSVQGQTEESLTEVQKEVVCCHMNTKIIDKTTQIAKTLCARDYKGFGTGFDTMNGVIEWK